MRALLAVFLSIWLVGVSNVAFAAFEKGDRIELNLGKDQNKNKISVENLRGKVVLLVFWATDREDSLTLLNHFEQLQREVPKDQLQVIAVNFKQDRKLYKKVLKQFTGFQSTFVHDKNGRYGRLFGLSYAPGLYMIDKDGVLKYAHRSYKKEHFEKRLKSVNKLLKKKQKSG